MTLYNYIKPLWRNGPHPVDDAPAWVIASIERTLRRVSDDDPNELIHLERDRENGLAIAWVRRRVSIQQDTSYRSASYVHAIAAEDETPIALTRQVAEKLLFIAYAGSIVEGIASQQQFFQQLEFPADMDVAMSLFVTKRHVEQLIKGGPAEIRFDSHPSDLLASSVASSHSAELAANSRETTTTANPELPQDVTLSSLLRSGRTARDSARGSEKTASASPPHRGSDSPPAGGNDATEHAPLPTVRTQPAAREVGLPQRANTGRAQRSSHLEGTPDNNYAVLHRREVARRQALARRIHLESIQVPRPKPVSRWRAMIGERWRVVAGAAAVAALVVLTGTSFSLWLGSTQTKEQANDEIRSLSHQIESYEAQVSRINDQVNSLRAELAERAVEPRTRKPKEAPTRPNRIDQPNQPNRPNQPNQPNRPNRPNRPKLKASPAISAVGSQSAASRAPAREQRAATSPKTATTAPAATAAGAVAATRTGPQSPVPANQGPWRVFAARAAESRLGATPGAPQVTAVTTFQASADRPATLSLQPTATARASSADSQPAAVKRDSRSHQHGQEVLLDAAASVEVAVADAVAAEQALARKRQAEKFRGVRLGR